LTVAAAAPVPVMTSVSGAVPLAFRTSLVAEIADGNGLDLGDQADAAFNALTGELVVAVPSIGASKTAAALTATGTTANGSAFFTSAAAILTPGEAASFLTIPEVTAPAPPPGQRIQLDPTGAGLTWAADPNTEETVIRVSRVGVKTNTGGELVQTTQDWLLTLPGPLTFPVKFPVAPPNLGDHPVPGFFEAGAVYDLSIEVRSFVEYDARTATTSPDILKAGYFKLRAVARTQTQFQVP
jgi:hypothetical protein